MDRLNKLTPVGIDFEHIFDISPDLILILDVKHNIIRANNAMNNCMGVSSGALVGSKCFWNMHQAEEPHTNCGHEQMLKDGQEHTVEVFLEPLDGWFSITVIPLMDNDGNISGSIHIARDITDSKLAEGTLKKSQLLLKSSLESQKDTILFSIDQDYRYLYFNKAHSEVMNYAYGSEIKIGTNILDHISVDDDRKAAKENYDRALQGESHSNIRIYGDLNLDYYESFFNPIVNDNNEIIGATGLARNITDRKAMEDALKLSEDRYKKAQEVGHIGGWEYDIKNNTFWGSDEGKRVYGFDPETDIFTAEEVMKCVIEKDKVNQALVDLIEKNQPYNIVFNIIPLNSTQKRTINSIAELGRNENGTPIKVTGVMQDITALKQAEEELKLKNEQLNQANAEKDKFFSIIAHDLRSPFQPLLGLTRILVEDLPTLRLDEIQKMALNMRGAANKLFDLLENLLEWSRMQRGLTIFEPESFLIFPKLSDSLDPTLEAITIKEIEIIYDISKDLKVYADSNMFESIIRNLLSNAIKFTAPKGKIAINAKQLNENWVEIAVKDTGIGMNKEILENLFKLDTNTNRKGTDGEPSSGLGLIICKDFIENHGGKLWVESEEGKGSTFHFTLPAKASA